MSESAGNSASTPGPSVGPVPAGSPAGGSGGGPASGGSTGPVAPAASEGPPLSISEAARLLARQRQLTREGQGQGQTQQTSQAPQGHTPAQAPAGPGGTPGQGGDPGAVGAAPGPLERALGVPVTIDQSGNPQPPAPMPTLEIDGRHYSHTELRESVLKARDYTQKTQALAEQQRALATVLPYIQPEINRLSEQIVQNPPQMPDPRLLETDPQQYHREHAAWERGLMEQQRLFQINTIAEQARQRNMEQAVAAGNEALAQEYPFWRDPEQRLQAQQQIVTWATTKGGFTKDDLGGLTSPQYLKALMKAAMFDRWMETAKTSAPPNGITPIRGSAPPPVPSERIQQAQASFDAKPDWRTGAALLAARRRSNGPG